MIKNTNLESALNELLSVHLYRDYCPNGLQIEGKQQIHKIATAVSFSQEVIEQAIEDEADALLVHHGLFWKNEASVIRGIKKKRIQALMKHDINLFAYHLPLDCHQTLGNNAQLVKRLGVSNVSMHAVEGVDGLLWLGEWENPIDGQLLQQQLTQVFQRTPLWLSAADKRAVQTVAWCTGAAQQYIQQAHKFGVDAYLSGEVSEQTYYQAKELNLHYFACGHHATERYGVQALGQHIAQKYDLSYRFYDTDNLV